MWKLFGDVWAHSVFVSNLPGGANEERRVLPTPLTSLLQSFIDWHFGGKAAVWELKRTQESGGDRQWRSAVADVAAHRCSFHPKAHLSGEVTACLLAALVLRLLFLYMPCGGQKCPATPMHCQGGSPMGLAAVGHLCSQLCVGVVLVPGSGGRSAQTGRVFGSPLLFVLLGASAWDS